MENPQKLAVVLDSNVIVSAVIFGGKPQIILEKVYKKELQGVISETILSELNDALIKYFKITHIKYRELNQNIKSKFTFVNPRNQIKICRDPADNKIIEAAFEVQCNYIITGDKDLLDLKKYKNIRILTPAEFLEDFVKSA